MLMPAKKGISDAPPPHLWVSHGNNPILSGDLNKKFVSTIFFSPALQELEITNSGQRKKVILRQTVWLTETDRH